MQVERSTILPAPVERVWALLADFDGVDRWHPLVRAAEIEDGLSGRHVGGVRALTMQDGAVIRERLLALSDEDRFFSYSILESPLPVEDYRSTLRLWPVSTDDLTFARWSVVFRCDPEDETTLERTVGDDIFFGGFDGLRETLNAEQAGERS